MDGDGFADLVAVADFEAGEGAAVLLVLGVGANDAVGIEGIVASDGGVAEDGDVVEEPAPGADGYIRTYDAEGADFDVLGNGGGRIDSG